MHCIWESKIVDFFNNMKFFNLKKKKMQLPLKTIV